MQNTVIHLPRKTVPWKRPLVAYLCASVIVLLICPSSSLAADWESLGPDGGSFLGSVSDPANADITTAITTYPSSSSAYRTNNGGQTWTKISEIPEMSLYAFAAGDFNTLYALSIFGCYCSKDGGQTWAYSAFPSGSGYGYSIATDPTNPDQVYVAGYKYVGGSYKLVWFESSDGGVTWSTKTIAQTFVIPYSVAVSQSNPDVIYIAGYKQSGATYKGALFKTSNSGVKWTDISSKVDITPNADFYSVAIDPIDDRRVYVGGYQAFYSSSSGGATWTKNTAYNFYAQAMDIDPVNTNNIYIAGNSCIYVSNDYGVTWAADQIMNGNGSCVDVAEANPSTIYIASTYGGFYKSVDTGATWDINHAGINGHSISAVAVAPSQPETLFIDINAASTVLGSYDCGDSWAEMTYPNGCSGTISDMIVNSTSADIVLALEVG